MVRMEIARGNVQITMAGIIKTELIAGTAMVQMTIIITGMGDLIKVPIIKIFNKKEVVETTAIPKVDRIDDK